ncbi:MAG: lysophospholipid acyltransferase family protein, partial [Fimbriiglobus sp.]
MAKPRRPAADFAVYLAVRAVVCVIQALPTTVAFAFADLLGAVAYRVDKRHRQVAAENLRHAFPELSEPERDRLVRRCYGHFAGVFVEILLLPRKFHVHNWRSYAKLENAGPVVAGLLDRRPLL